MFQSGDRPCTGVIIIQHSRVQLELAQDPVKRYILGYHDVPVAVQAVEQLLLESVVGLRAAINGWSHFIIIIGRQGSRLGSFGDVFRASGLDLEVPKLLLHLLDFLPGDLLRVLVELFDLRTSLPGNPVPP